jgi:hypothetical protein
MRQNAAMAGSRNHYEKAFSSWLTQHGVMAAGVDERVRPDVGGRRLKNFDFLVSGADAVFAIDVKGRRGSPWITRDDLFSLMAWDRLLDGAAQPALLFAFYAPGARLPARMNDVPAMDHVAETGTYRFCLLRIEDAQRLARPRSTRWGTYGFEWKAFCRAALPVDALLA